MKKHALGISLGFAVLSLGLAIAAAHGQQNNAQSQPSGTPAAAATADGAASHSKPTSKTAKKLNADQLYKINCTRCHTEVPKMDARRTATIMRHMRVRANIPQADMEAIFAYLKQ